MESLSKQEMANRIQAYEAIINEFIEQLEALDQYRAEHDSDKKQKRLFKVHSHEQKARRLLRAEQIRQGLLTNKKQAA